MAVKPINKADISEEVAILTPKKGALSEAIDGASEIGGAAAGFAAILNVLKQSWKAPRENPGDHIRFSLGSFRKWTGMALVAGATVGVFLGVKNAGSQNRRIDEHNREAMSHAGKIKAEKAALAAVGQNR